MYEHAPADEAGGCCFCLFILIVLTIAVATLAFLFKLVVNLADWISG